MPIGDELKGLKAEDITFGDEGLETETEETTEEVEETAEEGESVVEETEEEEATEEETEETEESTEESEEETEESSEETEEETEESTEEETTSEEDEFEEVDLDAEMVNMVTEATKGEYKDLNSVLAQLNEFKSLLKDDYIVNAAKHYNSSGSLKPYLEATAVDYDKLGDVDVLKRNWLKENEGLDPKFHDALFKEEVLEKYNLDGSEDYEEKDIELGTAKLQRDANKLRTQFKSEQEKFKQPPATPKEEPEAADGSVTATPEEIENLTTEVTASIGKHLSKSKDGKENILPVQIAQDVVHNIGITQESLDKAVNYAIDTDSLLEEFLDGDGNGDYSKWVDMVAFLENPEKYRKAIWDSGKSAGRVDFKKEVKGVKSKATTGKPARKEGETGDFAKDFLAEAKRQKIEREAAGLI